MEHVPSARTVLPGATSLEEVGHYLTPKPAVTGIDEGTIVELISGPFKGEKAVVKRVDTSKEEITVELYESVLPIPITVRGDHVRIIDRGEEFRAEASLAKYLSVAAARRVSEWAADLFGAASVVREHPVHKFPMDAWGASLGEGTQDVQKLIIFRELMKQYKK